jgi:hypothetical protein
MQASRLATFRRRIALVSTSLGLALLSIACIIYLRYASDPTNLHIHERVLHAQALTLLWRASLYGSAFLFVVSPFGLGWGRWLGLASNGAAFICALMTLGALCGPFGC